LFLSEEVVKIAKILFAADYKLLG